MMYGAVTLTKPSYKTIMSKTTVKNCTYRKGLSDLLGTILKGLTPNICSGTAIHYLTNL